MSDTARARDLLVRILNDEHIDATDVQVLLDDRVGESLFLDYKRGDWLRDDSGHTAAGKPTKAAAKLRKWVSGFANGEGGVIIIGAADGTSVGNSVPSDAWKLTGCRAPRGGDLSNWATGALKDLRPPLRMRVLVLDAPGSSSGDHVLVVAVEASDEFVWCAEAGSPVLYLRMNESTIAAPEWLVHDLVVGRRRRGQLVASGEVVFPWTREPQLVVDWKLTLENAGLGWALGIRAVAVGIAGLSQQSSPPRAPSASLREALAIRDGRPAANVGVVQRAVGLKDGPKSGGAPDVDLPPLADCVGDLRLFLLPLSRHVWCGALCFLTRNDIPRWAQLVLSFTDDVDAPRWAVGRVLPLPRDVRPRVLWKRWDQVSEDDRRFLSRLGFDFENPDRAVG